MGIGPLQSNLHYKTAMKENVPKSNKMESAKYSDANCATPTNKVLTFHSYLTHETNTYETPSRSFKATKVKNPFQQLLRENLGSSFISPSIFVKKTPDQTSFKWTIDELSILKPAEIDENQYASPERDEHFESLTKSRIDSYFSMQEILPSPAAPCESVPLINEDEDLSIEQSTSYAQTVLTLPPILPPEVEKVLAPYFNYNENQQGCEVQDKDTLYKELFDLPPEISEEHEIEVETHSEPKLSPVKLSPMTPSRDIMFNLKQRTIGTPGNIDIMGLCELSPICTERKTEVNVKKNKGANSTQIQAMDGSFNVPDCSIIDKHNSSQVSISSNHSSEVLNNSTINWDLEYKQLASPGPTTTSEEMEVSKSYTPKQRNIFTQRKKLSDSFGNEIPSDDEDEEEYMIISQQSVPGDVQDGDSGCGISIHQVGDNMTELWEGTDVVSSTPTKRQNALKTMR